ncbi:MAG: Protein-glutamate methylesterase [Verrucomicrobiales bacterium]|nr:Protein-glutamate methylesterase [Verrucomicrobiales bacterium]
MAFVLVQHLDPVHESALSQILGRATAMPVREATQKLPVVPNHVYVIPPNVFMTIERGVLLLRPRRGQDRSPHQSINAFFESLAMDQHERSVGVILSGTASDGTRGLEAIKAEGGITFAQDESAKYDSMPRNAIAAGCVDCVLSPENIARELARIARHPLDARDISNIPPALPAEAEREKDQREDRESPLAPGGHGRPPTGAEKAVEEKDREAEPRPFPEQEGFKKVLLVLRKHCGVDFSLYKSPTIQRRIARRLVLKQIQTLDDYAAFLAANPQELDALYSDVLISVTSFFRNPEAFEVLKRKVFPELISEKGREQPVRIWTLGCSTGQEAYSIAMAYLEFVEHLQSAPPLQLFATDLNDVLLEKARRGFYTKALAEDISPERLKRFFVEEETGFRVVKSLREMCVFARQNVLSDPPLSRMDLISCRNLLIYIEPGLQRKILPNFHYALNPKGFLFLGSSESVGSFTNLFTTIDKKERIFARKPGSFRLYELPALSSAIERKAPTAPVIPRIPGAFRTEGNAQHEADRVSANRFAPPGVLVNGDLEVLQFRGPTGQYLKLPTGKPSANLLKLARSELVLPLRAAMREAKKERKEVRRENIRMDSEGSPHLVNIEIIPLRHLSEETYLIFFHERKEVDAGSHPPRAASQRPAPRSPSPKAGLDRVAHLEHQLSDTRDYLQSVKDDSEASGEALQASTEELQSANEELQSINEELETSKEELESTNEELTTVNEEMANRNGELSRANSDLNNLQISINTAVLVLNGDLKVRRFTPPAAKIFNLLATDLDRPLGHIKHNLDFTELESFVAEVVFSLAVREREVQDNDGHWFLLRVRPYLTQEHKLDGAVLVLVDIDTVKRTEATLRRMELRYRRLFETSQDGILLLDPVTRKITQANPAFVQLLGYSAEELVGKELFQIGLLKDTQASQAAFEELKKNGSIRYEQLPLVNKHGEQCEVEFVSNLYREADQEVIQCNIRDITERKAFADKNAFLAGIVESSENSIVSISFDQIITTWNKGAEHLYGYSAREVIGKSLSVLTLPEDLRIIPDAIERIRKSGATEHLEVERKQKHGKHMLVAVTLSVIRNASGEPIGLSTISRDITERKKGEIELQHAKAILQGRAVQLEEIVADRTSQLRDTIGELEKFSYSVAHDMRAPLRGMQGFAKLLEEDYGNKLDEQGREYLRRIEGSAKRLDRLIQDVLSYTKILQGSAPMAPVDLDRLARDILATYPGWQAPLAEVQIAGTLPPVLGNEAFLTQCISNLVANAVKFVAPGNSPSVRIWADPKGPEIRLWFEDNGIGIDPKDQQRIFGMFDRIHAPREYEGTGIGLAIVKKAVERMGGLVGLKSQPGKGSKFWIQLKKA